VVAKTSEEMLKRLFERQKKISRKIDCKEKEKTRKLHLYLTEQRNKRFCQAGKEIRKIFNKDRANLDTEAIRKVCERYFH